MKNLLKLLLLLIPAIRDLISSTDDSVSLGKKIRILRILEDKDLSKLEKIERILFRKGGMKVEVYGYVVNGKLMTNEKIKMGVVVNVRLLEHYYDQSVELKRGLKK